MRTLIIPDLHNHTGNADYWMRRENHDRVVFLGDFFDDYGDNENDSRRTAVWLKNVIESHDYVNAVFLLGNHDIAYMFTENRALYCPGYTCAKAQAINEILDSRHWSRFQIMHEEQGWLLSHAGFHPFWLENMTSEWLKGRCDRALAEARRNRFDELLGADEDRGGIQQFGGPLWIDWKNLVPIPGIGQIVGHTPGNRVRVKETGDSSNYCFDVGNGRIAALLEGGTLISIEREV